jgi:hypothetical protein
MSIRREADDQMKPPGAEVSRAEEVRTRLVPLGIGEQDVISAISWARENE